MHLWQSAYKRYFPAATDSSNAVAAEASPARPRTLHPSQPLRTLLALTNHSRHATLDFTALRTWPMPQILWIELTSRCPFDCIFCSRKALRGAGEHLDFDLYSRVIDELVDPKILRLNYAGESGHYPRLAEAVQLAAATGAEVELVSALASLKPERLTAAMEAGLSRLTVSMHTLDAQRFESIYRFGSLAAMHQRLDQVLAYQAAAARDFVVDLAFVAMDGNLHELPDIARFAQQRGVGVLAVHPLIGRDPLPMDTHAEHASDGALRLSFRERLDQTIDRARQAAPDVLIAVSSYELGSAAVLSDHAQAFAGELPNGARIGGCDQSPFDSVHILADGRVVACEVTEKLTLGDLRTQSLREIWHGAAYAAFRARHAQALEGACRRCVYKTAYQPSPARRQIDANHANAAQMLRGWHAPDASGVRWGGAYASLWLPRDPDSSFLQISGTLASAHAGFQLSVDGEVAYQHQGADTHLQLRLPLSTASADQLLIEFRCADARSPRQRGVGADLRELGFGLITAALN